MLVISEMRSLAVTILYQRAIVRIAPQVRAVLILFRWRLQYHRQAVIFGQLQIHWVLDLAQGRVNIPLQ